MTLRCSRKLIASAIKELVTDGNLDCTDEGIVSNERLKEIMDALRLTSIRPSKRWTTRTSR